MSSQPTIIYGISVGSVLGGSLPLFASSCPPFSFSIASFFRAQESFLHSWRGWEVDKGYQMSYWVTFAGDGEVGGEVRGWIYQVAKQVMKYGTLIPSWGPSTI